MEKSKEFKKYWTSPVPSDKYPTLEMWHLSIGVDSDVEMACRLALLEECSELMVYYKHGHFSGYCLVPR